MSFIENLSLKIEQIASNMSDVDAFFLFIGIVSMATAIEFIVTERK